MHRYLYYSFHLYVWQSSANKDRGDLEFRLRNVSVEWLINRRPYSSDPSSPIFSSGQMVHIRYDGDILANMGSLLQ